VSYPLDWLIMSAFDAFSADEICLGELGEGAILESILRPRYADTSGFGDDCAVLGVLPPERPGGELVATTDNCPTPLMTILGEPDLYYTGWLLATINLSDLAAAGATPLGLVVNYILPRTMTVGEFRRLLDGVDDCCATHDTQVVGGDLRDGETMQLSATAIGRCAPGARLSRRGAHPGDRLLLIGSPGYLWACALLADGRAKLPQPEVDEIWSRAGKPMAQLTAGRLLAENDIAQAAMDVSDGLFATVLTLCDANDVGATLAKDIQLDPAVAEVCAQSGVTQFELAQTWGDWTLAAAVRAEDVETAHKLLKAESIPVREIGTIVSRADGLSLHEGDKTVPWQGIAQERFSPSSWHGGRLSDVITEVLGLSAA